ncbi:MAG TPA: serine hydrolase domain-containing protein [Acidobacteriaceae bacterium]|nr:serine hydrolase domain-containing protein [Acidobacteriaceae bacterium]
MPAESQFASAEDILRAAIAEKVTPGAAFGVLYSGHAYSAALGHFTYDPGSPAVTSETIYDVASLTKIVATTSMAMILYDRGLLKLDTPLEAILPAFNPQRDPARAKVTLRMLLSHSSGLPAHEYLDRRCRTHGEALAACLAMPLESEPGTAAVYSDIGFILLGLALEKIAGEPLDRFCAREIFQPLGMTATLFNPPPSLRAGIPPTQSTPHLVQGTVRDENAALLFSEKDGIAAHAGLFSNVPDLLRFARCILNGGEGLFKPATVALFTTRTGSPSGSSRALGWDTPSEPSSSGHYFSPHSAGHLGYTGTSLWLDLDRSLAVVLLTNRTWPDHGIPQAAHLPGRQAAIRRLRPAFHDALLKALLASSASATRSS